MARIAIKDVFEVVLPLALASSAYAFALSGGEIAYQARALLGFYLLLLVGVLTKPAFWRIRWSNVLTFVALALVLGGNIVLNYQNYASGELPPSLARALALAALLFSIQWIVGQLEARRILKILSIGILPLLLGAFASQIPFPWGVRLAPLDIHPNWWGELLFAFSASALAFRTFVVRWGLLVLAALLLYLVQARGAMLACGVTVMVVILYEYGGVFRRGTVARLILGGFLAGMAALAAVVVLTWNTGVFGAVDFVRDKVLLVHDEYRGLGTGVTGRLEAWAEAWSSFLDRPLLGHGIDTMPAVHNGFLILASEGGILLLTAIGWLLLNGIADKRRTGNYVALAIIVGYLALVMTYPRFLNLNLAATVFYIALFPWKPDDPQATARSVRRFRPVYRGNENTKDVVPADNWRAVQFSREQKY